MKRKIFIWAFISVLLICAASYLPGVFAQSISGSNDAPAPLFSYLFDLRLSALIMFFSLIAVLPTFGWFRGP